MEPLLLVREKTRTNAENIRQMWQTTFRKLRFFGSAFLYKNH